MHYCNKYRLGPLAFSREIALIYGLVFLDGGRIVMKRYIIRFQFQCKFSQLSHLETGKLDMLERHTGSQVV